VWQEYYDYQSKICNPRYPGGGGRGIKVQEQSRKKQKILSEKETEIAKCLGAWLK
jgi:hypothetical protein